MTDSTDDSDTSDGSERPVTRRDALKGSLALGGAAVTAGFVKEKLIGTARAAVSDGLPKIEFGDAQSDPAQNGVMARNGTDVKVFTGGALKNMSNIGSGSGGALSDSGTDSDGGDVYVFPNAADNLDFQGDGSILNLESLSTEDVSVTNETAVDARLGSSQSLTAGDWSRVELSTTNFDTRSEFDTTNHTFSPDTAGIYIISLAVEFGIGADKDGLWIGFDDASQTLLTNNPKISVRTGASGTRNHTLIGSGIVELDSSVDYALKARNIDSGDSLASDRTFLQIRSGFD